MSKLFVILLALMSAAEAVVWDEGTTGELCWGEALILDNYSLHLVDFSQENAIVSQALVLLQKDNATIARRALGVGESFSLNDSVKVTVKDVVMGDQENEPYADLKMQFPAVPELSLLLVADKELYHGGDMIRLEFLIENTGVVDAEELRVILNSNPSLVKACCNKSMLRAGSAWDENRHTAEIDPIKINLRAPYLLDLTEFNVIVHAMYSDPQGRWHDGWGGTMFRISGPLQLHKQVEELQDFGKSYYVTNTLRSSGDRALDVTLSDSTGASFRTNSSLAWKLNLSPGETKIVSYEVKAEKPGEGLALPQARASFVQGDKTYQVFSEGPVVKVLGPYVEAKRSASSTRVSPGKDVDVSIELNNTGNRKAMVYLRETVPEGATLVNENANGSFMLGPNKNQSMEYRIRCIKPGKLKILPTQIIYRDVRGNTFSASTPPLAITVEEVKKIVPNATNLTQNISSNADARRVEEPSFNVSYFLYLFLAIIISLSAAFSRYP